MASRARRGPPELEPVLRRLYGGLNEDLSFCRILEVVADGLRSHVSAVHFEDYQTHQSRLEVVGPLRADELASLTRDYAGRWHGQNLWLKRGIEQLVRRGYGDGDEVVSEAELLEMPYYQHFLRRIDVRHGLGICLWHDGPERLAVASFNRPVAEGPFSRETMDFIAALSPHLVNAFAIYKRAGQLKESNQSLHAAIDRAPIGMMVLGLEGRVLLANDEAERLLAKQAGIMRGGQGVLSFECSTSRRRFREAIAQLTSVTATTHPCSLPVTRAIACVAPTLILHLCALPPRMSILAAARCVAFLCPVVRDDSGGPELLMIQTALELTAAETRVLMELRIHCDLEKAAIALGVAPSTVRTHLKHAFAKTGTHKLAELLARVERIVTLAPRSTTETPVGNPNQDEES